MKRIEDAPKELQDMFADVWERVVYSAGGISDYRDEIEHVFVKGILAGYDIGMASADISETPKRTIKEIIKRDGEILGFSSDGKVYRFIWHSQEWYPLPDLPQD